MFAFPVSAMLAATPHAFVSGFLGGAWATAAKLIPYFCLYAAIRAVIEPLPAGFLALGRPEVLARIQLGHAALVSTLAISAAYVVGIEGVAISVLVAYAIAAVPILFRSKDVLGLGLRPISAAVAPHFVAGMAIYLTISAALAITSADLSLLFLLAVYIAGLGAFLLVSSALSKGRVLDDIRFVVRSITGRGRESAPGGNVETLSVSEGTFGR
jgi:O-antigen/teichoic acid export membrane protein